MYKSHQTSSDLIDHCVVVEAMDRVIEVGPTKL